MPVSKNVGFSLLHFVLIIMTIFSGVLAIVSILDNVQSKTRLTPFEITRSVVASLAFVTFMILSIAYAKPMRRTHTQEFTEQEVTAEDIARGVTRKVGEQRRTDWSTQNPLGLNK